MTLSLYNIVNFIGMFICIWIILDFLLTFKTKKYTKNISNKLIEHLRVVNPEIAIIYDPDKARTNIEKKIAIFMNKTKIDLYYKDRMEKANVKIDYAILFRYQITIVFLISMIFINFNEYRIYAILMIGAVFLVPVMYFKYLHTKRINKFSYQLSKACRNLASSLRAGYSFNQAFLKIGKEFEDPIGTEFTIASIEMNLGIEVKEALNGIYDRVPNDDYKIFKSAVIIQRKTGGNLADTMEKLDEMITARVKLKREAKTMTAQGRGSGMIVTGIPVALFFALSAMNPEYTHGLTTTPIGIAALIVSAIMLTIGWLLIKKITTIK